MTMILVSVAQITGLEIRALEGINTTGIYIFVYQEALIPSFNTQFLTTQYLTFLPSQKANKNSKGYFVLSLCSTLVKKNSYTQYKSVLYLV